MEETSDDLCGIDDKDDAFVSVGQVNRLIRKVNLFHLKPLREDIKNYMELNEKRVSKIEHYIDRDEIAHAKIEGGIVAIKHMLLWIPSILVALVVAILWLAHKAGLVG